MSSNVLSRQLTVDINLDRSEIFKMKIIKCLGKSKSSITIQEIADAIKTSVPTCTKMIKELSRKRLVSKMDKKFTENGRRPATYALNKDKFYAVGVEILSKFIHASIVKLDFETIHEKVNREFRLEDNSECLKFIIKFISDTIQESGINKENIIGVGIGMVENIKGKMINPIEYFQSNGISIKAQIETALGLPVLIDNETRVIALAEQVLGLARDVSNGLVVKVSRTIGMGIIINGSIITGSKGLSGNLSHTQFQKNNRLCYCGKKGCVGTAIGGDALMEDLKEALESGRNSIYFNKENFESYKYHDILDAANIGDELSINLIQQQGNNLGEALGNILNILNPELLIIDGEYLMLGDLFIDAIKNGLRKTTLVNVIFGCRILPSTLGRYLSSKAGAAMVFNKYILIEI